MSTLKMSLLPYFKKINFLNQANESFTWLIRNDSKYR